MNNAATLSKIIIKGSHEIGDITVNGRNQELLAFTADGKRSEKSIGVMPTKTANFPHPRPSVV